MLSVWFIFIMITLLFFIWDQYYIPWKKQKISFFHSHIVILVFNLFSFRNATSITFESSKQERISVIKNVYSFLYSFGSRNREPLFFYKHLWSTIYLLENTLGNIFRMILRNIFFLRFIADANALKVRINFEPSITLYFVFWGSDWETVKRVRVVNWH